MNWRSPIVFVSGALIFLVIIAVGAAGLSSLRALPRPTPLASLPAPSSVPTSSSTLTTSSVVLRADTATMASSPALPTRPPPPQPARVVLSNVVSLSQVTPVSVDTTIWKSYADPNHGLALLYPPDWTMVTSPGTPTEWVSFYPRTSDPQEPSPSITLYVWPNRPLPADRPANILVGSHRGSEVERQPGTGVMGSYDLLVAYRSGTIEFNIGRDLRLKSALKAMLGTLTLSP